MIDQVRKRITTATTTPLTTAACAVHELVISCQSTASLTLRIEDNASPVFVLFPTTTLAVPTTGPLIIKFDNPVKMIGGIDAVTTGTGEVAIWATIEKGG
jgi:hypothetical protein